MEKKYDYQSGETYSKIYKADEIVEVPAFIEALMKRNVQISSVILDEGVELEMQSVKGDSYGLEQFLRGYSYIRKWGNDLRYLLNCIYEGKPLRITLGEKSKAISLSSEDSSLELSDILGEGQTA